jgi:pSer/pThr/pTyr-binding forkhead associated (FHA) protein
MIFLNEEDKKMVLCHQCGFQNEENNTHCVKCNAILKISDKNSETTISFVSLETDTKEELLEEFNNIESTASFVVKKGPNVGEQFSLAKNRIALGREPNSDIFLNDITVSRKHAAVTHEPSGFVITDESSLNGTYVNKKRVGKAILNPNDEVQIGKFILVFLQPKFNINRKD